MAILDNKITITEAKQKVEEGLKDETIKESPKGEEGKQDQKDAKVTDDDKVITEGEGTKPDDDKRGGENADAGKSDADAGKSKPGDVLPEKEKEVITESNDIEKRYKESSREALIQLNRSRSLIKTAAEAIAQTVTDEEIDTSRKGKFTDDAWEELTTGEQELWKEHLRTSLQLQKQQEKIKTVITDIENEDAYQGRVNEFISKSQSENKHQIINGREDDFTRYCMQKNHKGVDPEILVNAFAFEAPSIKKKQSLLNTTSGGGIITAKQNPGSQKMSTDDVQWLMKNDQKKFQEYLRSGVIKAEDVTASSVRK